MIALKNTENGLPAYNLLDPTGNITILAEIPFFAADSSENPERPENLEKAERPKDPEKPEASEESEKPEDSEKPEITKESEKPDLPSIAKRLMELEPSAEQVGFLSGGDGECDITLTMAGGEFCGNATLSAAAVFLAAEKKKNPCAVSAASDASAYQENEKSRQPLRHVTVRVSGADAPVPVEMRRISENHYEGTVRMPEVQSVTTETLFYEGQKYTLPVVRFDGIAHILMEEPMEKTLAEKAVVQWCGALNTDALGIMQIGQIGTAVSGNPAVQTVTNALPEAKSAESAEKSAYDASPVLLPLVYVRTADTLYWESSCASGTTAAGVYLSQCLNRDVRVSFREPAGVLTVHAKRNGELYLTGTVRILNSTH